MSLRRDVAAVQSDLVLPFVMTTPKLTLQSSSCWTTLIFLTSRHHDSLFPAKKFVVLNFIRRIFSFSNFFPNITCIKIEKRMDRSQKPGILAKLSFQIIRL